MKVEVTEMTVNVSRRVRRIAAALSPMTTNISGKYWLSGDQVMIMYSNNNLCIVRDHSKGLRHFQDFIDKSKPSYHLDILA